MISDQIIDELILTEHSTNVPSRYIREMAAEIKQAREKIAELDRVYDEEEDEFNAKLFLMNLCEKRKCYWVIEEIKASELPQKTKLDMLDYLESRLSV